MRLNPVLEKLTPYRAGPPLEDIRRRYHLERVSRLSANESPWGPFPEVIEAMKGALDGLNRYPDGACSDVRSLLAEQAERRRRPAWCSATVPASYSCSWGRSFSVRGGTWCCRIPSFVMYRRIALARGASFTAVELPELDYDLEAMLAAIQEDTTLLVICNPNNPTGSHVPGRELQAFLCARPGRTWPWCSTRPTGSSSRPAKQVDSVAWLDEFPNLVVLRTFSKIFGLAGLRVGYGIADPELVQALDKVASPSTWTPWRRWPRPTSLRLPERMDERQADGGGRAGAHRRSELDALGVAYHPSEANFILFDVTRLGHPGHRGGSGPAGERRADPLGLCDGMPWLDSGYHR